MKYNKTPSDVLFGIFSISCLSASALGFVIIVWCILKRKLFAEIDKSYLWQTVLFEIATLTSPSWLIIAGFFIFGVY